MDKNLGFKVGKVKSVDDAGGLGDNYPVNYDSGISAAANTSSAKSSSLDVQPGENDLSYSVNVVYYIR